MSERKRKSGGQAIVMVTLALFAMAGMMGLAVDLGWSFFVQKQAQTSADGAAMAAVHRAFEIVNGNSASANCTLLDCVGGDCKGTISGTTSSNLLAGCLYAKSNGFDWDTFPGSKQTVNIVADTGVLNGGKNPPTVSNVNNIAYWATVRTVQTIPQLFSAIAPGNGSSVGTVAAVATAALVAETIPASFYGLDRVGECLTHIKNSTTIGPIAKADLFDCGVDVDVAGNGSTVAGCPGSAVLCGPAGIMLSSACNNGKSTSPGGCADPGSSKQNFAGNAKGPGLVSSGTQIRVFSTGTVNDPTKFDPTPVGNASLGNVGDPFDGQHQPPIVANTSSCELTSGVIAGGASAANPTYLGPYQYYVKTSLGAGKGYALGAPISLGSGFYKFSTLANIPGGGNGCSSFGGTPTGTPPTGKFPSYIFYGGLAIRAGDVAFTDGQYVLAGTSLSLNATGNTLDITGGNLHYVNVSGAGTMIVTTDGLYTTGSDASTPGLTAPTTSPTPGATISSIIDSGSSCGTTGLCQGGVQMKGATVNLTGIDFTKAGAAFENYDNILLWQDRRNSTSTYNADATTITASLDPASGAYNATPIGNHVTNVSPQFLTDDGNGTSKLTGVIHQPRGAWINFQPGTAAGNNPLQIFTGAFITYNGGGALAGGNVAMTLQPLTNTVVVFRTALIQ